MLLLGLRGRGNAQGDDRTGSRNENFVSGRLGAGQPAVGGGVDAEDNEAGLDLVRDVENLRDNVIDRDADHGLGGGARLIGNEAIEIGGGVVDRFTGIAGGGCSGRDDVEKDDTRAELAGEFERKGRAGFMQTGERNRMQDRTRSAGGQLVGAGTNGADRDVDEVEKLASDRAEDKFLEAATAVGSDDEATGIGVPDDFGNDIGGKSVTDGGGAVDSLAADFAGDVFEKQTSVAIHTERVIVGDGAGFHRHGFMREDGVDEDEGSTTGSGLGNGMWDEVVGIGKVRGNNDFARTRLADSGIEDWEGHNVPHSGASAGYG